MNMEFLSGCTVEKKKENLGKLFFNCEKSWSKPRMSQVPSQYVENVAFAGIT